MELSPNRFSAFDLQDWFPESHHSLSSASMLVILFLDLQKVWFNGSNCKGWVIKLLGWITWVPGTYGKPQMLFRDLSTDYYETHSDVIQVPLKWGKTETCLFYHFSLWNKTSTIFLNLYLSGYIQKSMVWCGTDSWYSDDRQIDDLHFTVEDYQV